MISLSILVRRCALAIGVILSAAGCTAIAPPPTTTTEVMLVASLHSAHKDNPRYSYDDLFAAVRRFRPDIVAVEIRQEDLARGSAYLAKNYPFEMRALASEYGAKVRGFDWFGPELEGRPVPEKFWAEQSWVKRLEREKAVDPAFRAPEADARQQEQLAFIKSATASSFNGGAYDKLSRDYYAAFARAVKGTKYAPLSDFSAERDRRVAANIRAIVRANPGRRIAVVLGADHRAEAVEELKREFGRRVMLVPVE